MIIEGIGELEPQNMAPGIPFLEEEIPLFTKTFYIFKGLIEGRIIAIETIRCEIAPWVNSTIIHATFYGTINGSKPGIFTMVLKGLYNQNLPYPRPFRAQIEIIPGSGQGPFEGLIGIGEIAGVLISPYDEQISARYYFHLELTEPYY